MSSETDLHFSITTEISERVNKNLGESPCAFTIKETEGLQDIKPGFVLRYDAYEKCLIFSLIHLNTQRVLMF